MTIEEPDIERSEEPRSSDLISKRVTPRKRGVLAYSKNPFWEPYKVDVGTRKITIAGGMTTNTATGEAMQHSGIHRIEQVDEDKFVKLFTQNIKLFFDLTGPSQKILQCVIATLQDHPNADGISLPWFTVDDFSQKHDLKISKTSFHRGMNEMLLKGFIAESELPHFYWINPHLFFNGNRMVFITEYRKAEKPNKTPAVTE
jgi:hypothetical protein